MADQDPKRTREPVARGLTIEEETTAEFQMSLFTPERGNRVTVLEQVSGPGAPRYISLDRRVIVIGRSRRADFTIETPELSRRHIAVEFDGAEFTCTDLDSQNGLYLNGIEVHSCVLRGGDTLQLGNVTFIFREAGF